MTVKATTSLRRLEKRRMTFTKKLTPSLNFHPNWTRGHAHAEADQQHPASVEVAGR
jgi:hypothetical protein